MFAAFYFKDQGFHGTMKILGQNISAGWLHKSVKHDLISRCTKNAISPIGIIQIFDFGNCLMFRSKMCKLYIKAVRKSLACLGLKLVPVTLQIHDIGLKLHLMPFS